MTFMNDLVQRIFNSIIRMEGMPADHTNPGNCRDCPWFAWDKDAKGNPVRVYPAVNGYVAYVSYKNGFWVPRTRGEGIAGGSHVVNLRIAEGQNLVQLITSWAPPSENATATYIANVKAWAGIPDEHQPLWNFIETLPT